MNSYLSASIIALLINMSSPYAYADNACTAQKVETLIKELESISWNPPTEAGGEYSGELMEQLGECRNPKAIPAMLNVIGHAGGSLVVDAFAKIGPSVIPALTQRIRSGTKSEKKAALFYLGKLPETLPHFGYTISSQHKKEIKETYKKNINDEDYEVREATVQAISNTITVYGEEDKRELIKLLEFAARSDSYFVRRKVADKEITIYPVRDKATAILKNINQ